MKKNTLLIVIILIVTFSFAQKPSWTANLGSISFDNIEYIRKAGTSIIIIGTKKNIYGISSEQKKIVWQKNFSFESQLPKIIVNSESPYIIITKDAIGFNKKETTILNAETGFELYSNQDSNNISKGQTFLQNKKVLINIFKNGSDVVLEYINLETGLTTWKKTFGSEDIAGKGLLSRFGGMIDALKIEDNSNTILPIYVDKNADLNQNFIVWSRGKIFYLNEKDGSVIWSKNASKEFWSVVTSDDNKYVYYNDKGKLNYLDLSSVKEMLEEPIATTKVLTEVKTINENYYLIYKNGFNVLQQNGKLLRKKDFNNSWIIKDIYLQNDGGFLVKGGSTNMQEGNLIAKISSSGDEIWKKSFNRLTLLLEPMPTGIIGITTDEVNFYNYLDGKEIWEKPLKFTEQVSVGYDMKNLIAYTFQDDRIDAIDLLNGTYKNVVQNFKFKDKLADADVKTIEYRDNGLFLAGGQNIAFLEINGKERFNKSYVDVLGITKKFKNTVSTIGTIAGIAGVGLKISSVFMKNAQDNKNVDKIGEALITGSDFARNAINFAESLNFKALNNSNTMTVLSNDNSPVALVINKNTGVQMNKIKINDLKPILYMDDSQNMLYVINQLMQMSVYDLK